MDPGIKNQRWKIRSIQENIATCSLHTPFFILTETHLKLYHLEAEVCIPEYTAYRADREQRAQGGVAIYLHNSIPADTVKSFSNSYCEVSFVFNSEHNFLITAVYRPPSAPYEKFHECLTIIQNFINSLPGMPELYIAGDFNLPFIDWQTRSITAGSHATSSDRSSGLALLEFLSDNFLEQLVHEPTRNDKNILDLVFSNNTDLIHSVTVSKTEKSDHDIIYCNLLHPHFLLIQHDCTPYSPTSELDDLNFNKADWGSINEDLLATDWSAVTNISHDQDLAWDVFERSVIDVCKKHCPSHSHNRQLAASSKLPKSRRLLLRKKKRLNARINCIKYKLQSFSLPCNSVKLKKLNDERAAIELPLKADIKQQRLKEELNALANIKSNPKAFYSFAKKHKTPVSSVGPLLDSDGQLQSDPIRMGSILQDQYAKIFSNPDLANPAEVRVSKLVSQADSISDIVFGEEDVLTAIKSMDRYSAAGPDKFPVSILKECGPALAPVITQLWRASLDNGNIAEKFKSQSVIPLFKKGKRSVAANYRPVSLTSHLIKLFERVVRAKLVDFIADRDIINANQHGFRSGRSCLTQLLHHIEDIMNDLDADHNADVLYLDFSKAFDKVDHRILLKKLHLYGIRGKVYTLVGLKMTAQNLTVFKMTAENVTDF